MKEQYRTAIKEISFSDDDKARILANVLKACEDTIDQPSEENKDDNISAHTSRPEWSLRFSPRRIGAVAVAFIVLCVSVVLIRNQYITLDHKYHEGQPGMAVTMGASMELVWEELDSVEEIAEKTDCKTYTLANLSKKYKVKKVEVANAQRHVKITYQKKKAKDDRIFFEYKEESDSDEIKSQFSKEAELATEKVDGADVKMYGKKKCSGMTWEDSDCTFAVKMSKACSTDNARRIVSGTQEEKRKDKTDQDTEEIKNNDRLVNSNIVGWDGSEKASSEKEMKKVLRKVYNNLGFCVLLNAPAEKVTYKYIDGYESFAFYYEGDAALEDNWIIGYAGGDGSPDGTMEDYDKVSSIVAGDVTVTVYLRDNDEKLLIFSKEDICFTLFIDEYDDDVTAEFLEELISVFKISFEEETDETEEDDPSQTPEDEEEDPDRDNTTNPDSGIDCYVAAQEIQEVVAGKSLKRLSSYISFPLMIDGLDITVNSKAEFQRLDAGKIFTSEWVDAVLFCDIENIKPKAKSFTLGDSDNSLVCKVKDGDIVITELHVVVDDSAEGDPDVDRPEENTDDELEYY